MKRSNKRRIRRAGPIVSRGFMDHVAPRILAPYGLAIERRRRSRPVVVILGALVLGKLGLTLISRARRASEQRGRAHQERESQIVHDQVAPGLS